MKHSLLIIKTAIVVVLCFLGHTICKAETPDFAFPKTVQADAEASLSANLRQKDYPEAINSMIQIVISRQLINADNASGCISLCDSVARQMPSPYSGLARLVEARLLKEMYQNQKWVYDSRTLPEDSVPQQPEFWSSGMFRDKVVSLVIDCCTTMPEADLTIGDISKMLIDWERADRIGLTVADFMRMQAVECLMPFFNSWSLPANIIPFTPLSRDDNEENSALGIANRLCAELYERGLNSDNPDLRAYIDVWLAARINEKGETPTQFLLSELESMGYEPKSLPLLLALMRYNPNLGNLDSYGNESKISIPSCTPEEPIHYFGHTFPMQEPISGKEAYDYLKEMGENLRNDDAEKFRDVINNQIAWFSREKLSLATRDQYVPGDSIEVNVTFTNINDGYIHVYKLPAKSDNEEYRRTELINLCKSGEHVFTKKISLPGIMPFSASKKITLPSLPPGDYVTFLLPDEKLEIDSFADNEKWGDIAGKKASVFSVSSLAIYFITEKEMWNVDRWRVLVTDASSGAPIEGASVDVATLPDGKEIVASGRTDKNGLFSFQRPSFISEDGVTRIIVTATHDGSKSSIYSGMDKIIPGVIMYGKSAYIFTDISLLHPGDTVKFVAIGSYGSPEGVKLSRQTDLQFRLYDPKNNMKDSLLIKSDDNGRFVGSFEIPKESLLGDWKIIACDAGMDKDISFRYYWYPHKGDYIGLTSFQVAEYKVPSFFVTAQNGLSDDTHLNTDSITFSGMVSTFTGMPLDDVKVNYEIRWRPFWWRSSTGEASYGGEVTTDAQGRYEVKLPLSGLKGTKFENGTFTFRAKAVAASGETQQSDFVNLSLGNGLRVLPEVPSMICVEGSQVMFNVPVRDAMGLPVKREVEWRLHDDSGKLLSKGVFMSPTLSIPSKLLKSGSYRLSFHIVGNPVNCDGNGDSSADFVIWRKNDAVPPVETSLWIDENTIYAEPDQKSVKLRVGSSYKDSHVLAVITTSDGDIQYKWLLPKRGFTWLKVDVPDEDKGVMIFLYAIHDLKLESQSIRIYPHSQNVKVKIETETFRDQLSAGEKEHWKFRILRDGKPLSYAPAMAVLSDKALDAIYPSEWILGRYTSYYEYLGFPFRLNWRRIEISNYSLESGEGLRRKWLGLKYPKFRTYDLRLFNSPSRLRGISNRHIKMAVNGAAYEETEVEDVVVVAYGSAGKESLTGSVVSDGAESEMLRKSDAMVTEEAAADGVTTDPARDVETELRPVEMPVAFFKPSLNANGEGVVDIDFEVPNFNTTWKFRMLAYDSQLHSATLTLNTVAAKRVMVRSNPPSFLRTGDEATISAMLFNNSDVQLGVSGRIEIFDPASGNIYIKEEFPALELEPSGSRSVSVNWKVPADISIVGMRFYALGGDFSDGEQTLVVVLPSSSPVIESTPFWLSPKESKFSMDIPDINEDAKVTLQYCANPMWYAVTSLPVRKSDIDDTSLSLIDALFNGKVADGLLDKYPVIKDALKDITDNRSEFSRMLTSALERDPQLKILPLNLTPWTVDAAAETLRLSSLSTLLDSVACTQQNDELMNGLSSLQESSGGFRWFKDWGVTSEFVTERVLSRFALMRDLGCVEFTQEMDAMCDGAIKYLDEYYVEEKKGAEHKKRSFDPAIMIPYLYIRSSFSNPDTNVKGFSKLKEQALIKLKENWKSYDVYNKSIGAMLLYRSGMQTEARNIIRSLGEYTSSSKQKGVWFANERSYYSPYSTLHTVASVLRAFMEIDPQSELIEGMTQWLLLSRQTIDWGKSSDMSAVIATVIKSSPGWIDSSEDVEIKVGDKRLNIGAAEHYTGEFSTELDPVMISGKTLTVERQGDVPAWGGIISRFTQPMKDVKEEALPDLSVTKDIYPITVDADGTKASSDTLKVGDRVKVTVKVHCGRDLQYVVLNDELPACLRPVDQLSGYNRSEGVRYNCQQRAATTSLMIPFLPKGDFIFTYECFVERPGVYSSGIVTVQSQSTPVYVAHSAGSLLTVK